MKNVKKIIKNVKIKDIGNNFVLNIYQKKSKKRNERYGK